MGHDKIHVATFARPQAFSERGKNVQLSQGELWIEISHYLQKNTFPRGTKWRLQKDTLFSQSRHIAENRSEGGVRKENLWEAGYGKPLR